jgi:DNA-binding transcriptional LysR family regulator
VTARGCEIEALDHLVRTYNTSHPRERPAEAVVINWQAQAGALRDGDVDVGLLRHPFDDRGIDSDVLWTEPRVTLLSAGHVLASRTTIDRAELAGETIAVWPGTTEAETAHWTGTDLGPYDWRPGPALQDMSQLTANVRLARTIAFAPLSLVGDSPPPGVAAVPTEGLSDSRLHVAWASTATSPDVARFVRHAAAYATAR